MDATDRQSFFFSVSMKSYSDNLIDVQILRDCWSIDPSIINANETLVFISIIMALHRINNQLIAPASLTVSATALLNSSKNPHHLSVTWKICLWAAFTIQTRVFFLFLYLQWCRCILALGDICLGNWVRWKGLPLVLSPRFHTALPAVLLNCFSLRESSQMSEIARKHGDGEWVGILWQNIITCFLLCCPRQPKHEKTCNNCDKRFKIKTA